MLLTLALVILFGAKLVIFSDEFIRIFKKIFAIKGAKLFLPLFIASWLIYTFDFWVLWAIFYLREIVHLTMNFLMDIMPFQPGAKSVSMIVLLTIFSVVPVILLDHYSRKKTHKGYKTPYFTSTLIWILSVVFLIII